MWADLEHGCVYPDEHTLGSLRMYLSVLVQYMDQRAR